ncbi:hypothetical protein M404DRAFT_1008964, partial [Pisolithus tinctorius Marx 270]
KVDTSYQARIMNQLHRLGGSYDWDCVTFTMGPVSIWVLQCRHSADASQSPSKVVIETFCRLHEGGILYRANCLVNWCVKL